MTMFKTLPNLDLTKDYLCYVQHWRGYIFVIIIYLSWTFQSLTSTSLWTLLSSSFIHLLVFFHLQNIASSHIVCSSNSQKHVFSDSFVIWFSHEVGMIFLIMVFVTKVALHYKYSSIRGLQNISSSHIVSSSNSQNHVLTLFKCILISIINTTHYSNGTKGPSGFAICS